MAKGITDLGALHENERIRMMADQVRSGCRVGFFVEDEEKADRYLRKLRVLVPLEVLYRGTAEGALLITIGPKAT